MGDMPHGWACAEFILLLRDMLFFEADEDGEPHIYLVPGIRPQWLDHGQSVRVQNARTVFGASFDFRLRHSQPAKTLEIEILRSPRQDVSFIYHCRLGAGVGAASADGKTLAVTGAQVRLPAGTKQATVTYL